MLWYDLFANFYDTCLDRVYVTHRRQAASALALSPGMTVVDVGCGTGASFESLVEAVGSQGRVIGIDASAGMLKKAKKRVERKGWKNVETFEIEIDREGEIDRLSGEIGHIDRVLCFLSLSVIDDWKAVLEGWFDALDSGSRLVIADVHNPKPGLYGRYVELISRGTLDRKAWEPLEEMAKDFTLEWKPSSWVLGGAFFVAAGSR